MSKESQVKCPSCGELTHKGDMTTHNDKRMCEGCAESSANLNYYDDPHGRNWTNSPDY